jgi:hypothetical protein
MTTELAIDTEPTLPKRRKRKRRARGKVAKRVRLARTKNSSRTIAQMETAEATLSADRESLATIRLTVLCAQNIEIDAHLVDAEWLARAREDVEIPF